MTQILIVDNEIRLLDSLTVLLDANQYEVKTASCAQDALTLLAKDKFDLAILDLHLPDKPGIEIMGDITAYSPDTPVIFITGDEDTDLALAALKCGAYAYLRKPFEFEELLKVVDHALHQKSLQREKDRLIEQLYLSEKRYRYLIQESPDIIYTLDVEGKFTFISDAVERLLGFRAADLIGKDFSSIVYEADHNRAQWLFNERRSRQRANSADELRLKHAKHTKDKNYDQRYVNVELKSAGIFEASSQEGKKRRLGTQGIIRDVSGRKLDKARIQAANRFLHIANRHSELLPLLEEFVKESKKVSGCSAVGLRLLDEDNKLPYAAFDGFDGDFCDLKEPLSISPTKGTKGMCIRVINNIRKPHESLFTEYGSYFVNSTTKFINSASDDQTRFMRNTCHHYGYETIALIPIRSGDATMGLIHLADRATDRLTENKVKIMEYAALQLGTAIERVKTEQALKDSYDILEKRVAERTKILSHTKDELLDEIDKRKTYEQELIGYQQRLRKLSSQLIQTEERERRRLATEIHDRIGQTLAVAKMQLGALQADIDSKDLESDIENIRELVSQTIRDIRTLTFQLSPPILYELGLHAALEWLAESIWKQSGLEVKITSEGSDRELNDDSSILLYRICRELMFNVVKHAAANSAQVNIHNKGDLVTIEFSDDGIGFDSALLHEGFDPLDRGFGLFSIQEQLEHHGGTLKIDSAPDQGSTLTMALPLTFIDEIEMEQEL